MFKLKVIQAGVLAAVGGVLMSAAPASAQQTERLQVQVVVRLDGARRGQGFTSSRSRAAPIW